MSNKNLVNVPVKLSLRTDALSNWMKINPVLNMGEVAVVVDENNRNMLKIGNGISAFSELKYLYEEDLKTKDIFAENIHVKSLAQGINSNAIPLGFASGIYLSANAYFSQVMGINAESLSTDSYAFVWSGDDTRSIGNYYTSNGKGTFSINPLSGTNGFYIGNDSLCTILSTETKKLDTKINTINEKSATKTYVDQTFVKYNSYNSTDPTYIFEDAKLNIKGIVIGDKSHAHRYISLSTGGDLYIRNQADSQNINLLAVNGKVRSNSKIEYMSEPTFNDNDTNTLVTKKYVDNETIELSSTLSTYADDKITDLSTEILYSTATVTAHATTISTLTDTSLNVMMIDEDDGIWLAATQSGIYRSTDNSKSWTKVYGNNSGEATKFASIKAFGNGLWLAGTYGGNITAPGIYKSIDNGLTWVRNTTPVIDHTNHSKTAIFTDVQAGNATTELYCSNINPWAFATGKLTIDNVEQNVIIAGLTARRGAVYSLDNGDTWYGGAGWTDLNTALLTMLYDDRYGGFPWHNGKYKWIAGGGNNTQNLGGLWYFDETQFKWIQETKHIAGSTLVSKKIQAITTYKTKTNNVYLYVSETAPSAYGKKYYCDAESINIVDCPTANSYTYSFVELNDGYLYITHWANGTVLRITNDGKSFIQYTPKEFKYGQGYALATDKSGCMLVCGYHSGGFSYIQTPILTQLIDRYDNIISNYDNIISNYDNIISNLDTTIKNDINNKIFIRDLDSNNECYTNLSIIDITEEEYAELAVTDALLSNALYLVSSDYINAYGLTIQNLIMTDDDVQSEAANKHYVDTQITDINTQLTGISQQIQENQNSITALEHDNTSNIENIDSLSTNLTTHSTNVGTLSSSVKTLSSNVNSLSTNLTTHSTNVGTLSSSVKTLSSDVNSLSSKTHNDINHLSSSVDNKILFTNHINETSSIMNSFEIELLTEEQFINNALNDVEYLSNHFYIISSDSINCFGNEIINVGEPTTDDSAVAKIYVDTQINEVKNKLNSINIAELATGSATETIITKINEIIGILNNLTFTE